MTGQTNKQTNKKTKVSIDAEFDPIARAAQDLGQCSVGCFTVAQTGKNWKALASTQP